MDEDKYNNTLVDAYTQFMFEKLVGNDKKYVFSDYVDTAFHCKEVAAKEVGKVEDVPSIKKLYTSLFEEYKGEGSERERLLELGRTIHCFVEHPSENFMGDLEYTGMQQATFERVGVIVHVRVIPIMYHNSRTGEHIWDAVKVRVQWGESGSARVALFEKHDQTLDNAFQLCTPFDDGEPLDISAEIEYTASDDLDRAAMQAIRYFEKEIMPKRVAELNGNARKAEAEASVNSFGAIKDGEADNWDAPVAMREPKTDATIEELHFLLKEDAFRPATKEKVRKLVETIKEDLERNPGKNRLEHFLRIAIKSVEGLLTGKEERASKDKQKEDKQ